MIRKPIRHSMLNLADYNNNISNILKDLEKIIMHGIHKYLNITSIKEV
jgi:hypothetical protein